jgi:hypothetical protein
MLTTMNNKQNKSPLVKKIFKKFILTLHGSMLWNNSIYQNRKIKSDDEGKRYDISSGP